MPSGRQTPIERVDAIRVADVAMEAIKHGLLVEWFEFFISGVQAGQSPVEAANLAEVEWDF